MFLNKQIAKDKKLALHFKKPKSLPSKLNLDANKIRQVVVNLIDNALKYTSSGEISVSLLEGGGWVEIRVRDTGIGISKEDKERLFAQFIRADGITKIGGSGSGLGLYVAREIARGHKGEVMVESEGKGHGSTFILRLPTER